MKKAVKTTLSLLLAAALLFALPACSGTGRENETAETTVVQAEEETAVASTDTQESEIEDQPTEENAAEEPQEEETTEDEESQTEAVAETEEAEADLVDGMRPEIKEAIDDYETFFDEYCAFMEAYKDSDDAISMLADYASFMARYAEAMEGLDTLGEEDLNDAELAYYIAATARIEQKLLEVTY